MKPKARSATDVGLLEYLEDIIGSSVYKEKIEEYSKIIDEIGDKSIMSSRTVNLARKELNDLEEPKNSAIHYVKTERKMFCLLNMQAQIGKYDVVTRVNSLQTLINEISSKIKEANEGKKDALQKYENHFKVYNEIMSNVQKITSEISNLKEKFDNLNDDDVRMNNDLAHYASLEAKAKENIKKTKKKHQSTIAEIREAENTLPQFTAKLSKLSKEEETESAEMEIEDTEVANKTENLQKEKRELEKECHPRQQEMNELKETLTNIENEMNRIQNKDQSITEEYSKCKKKKQETSEDIEKKSKELECGVQKFNEFQRNYESKEANVRELRDKERILCKELMDLQEKYALAVASVNDAKSYSKMQSEIMKAVSAKRLHGVRGRLGDLATIPKKFDVAISTASALLNAWVVNNVKQGQALLDFLAQNKLGKATIICLDKIRLDQNLMGMLAAPFNPPPDTLRLFDLIKVSEPDLAPAFYKATWNTLVAPNLDIASRTAYGQTRYRVVTLEGNLIEKSGLMSGGGRPRSGAMGHSEQSEVYSKRQIDDLKQNIELVNQNLVKTKEELKSDETWLENAKNGKGRYFADKKKRELEIGSLKRIYDEIDTRIKNLEQTMNEQRRNNKVDDLAQEKEECGSHYARGVSSMNFNF